MNVPNQYPPIAVLGESMVETIIHVDEIPTAGDTVVSQPDSGDLGGAAINVAWHVSHGGHAVRLIAIVGAAEQGELKNDFSSLPVDLSTTIQAGKHSDRLLTFLSPSQHLSAYILAEWQGDFIEHAAGKFGGCRVAILNGGRHADVRAAYASPTLHETKALTIFNPSYAIFEYEPASLRETLKLMDVVILNRDEYTYAADACQGETLLAEAPRLALIRTEGEGGATLFSGQMHLHVSPLRVREGHFLGAGDAFVSGVAVSLNEGADIRAGLDLGMKFAASVVSTGSIRAIPSR